MNEVKTQIFKIADLNPAAQGSDTISVEVKRDVFDEKALHQLIGYESWFLQKKVSGDYNMVRTTAIAKSFSDEVIQYVEQRTRIEEKPFKLLAYSYDDGIMKLTDVSSC